MMRYFVKGIAAGRTTALLTFGVAYVAMVAARYFMPAADRLEARLAGPHS